MILSSTESATQVTFHHGSMIRIAGLPLKVFERITEALTVSNPKYAQAVRFSGWHPRNIEQFLYGYTGAEATPNHGPAYNGKPGTHSVSIAPGFAAAAWGICQRAGLECRLVGQRTPELLEPVAYTGEIRAYQKEIVDSFHSRYGVLVAPCGSGKTDMGIQLMLGRNCRFLIVVHTLDLAEQWRERIQLRTGEVCGFIRGKKAPDHTLRFLVCTVQTLVKNPVLVDMLDVTRDGVLVDECHHTPSTTFTKVLARMAPAYRFGITATHERNDGTTAMIHWWVGPVIATLPQEALEAAGHVMRPRLEIHELQDVQLQHDPAEPGDYLRVMKEICAHQGRLKEVAFDISDAACIEDSFHLILAATIEYGMSLYELLNKDGLRVAVFNGKTKKKDRAALLKAAGEGQIDILIATTVADEGLDLPNLTDVWLATPIRAAGRVQQRLGRVCRPRPGKAQPILHDLVDTEIWRYKSGHEQGRRTKQFTFVEQFKHRFKKVYRQLCDFDEAEVRAVIGK